MRIPIFWKLNFKLGGRKKEIPTFENPPHVLTLTGFSTMTPEIKQQFQERIAGLYATAKKERAADNVVIARLHERLAKAKIREYKIAKKMYGEENYRLHARANLQAKWSVELKVFKDNPHRFPENHYAQEHYFKRLELRSKARALYLAYAYLRNVNYYIVEFAPRWKRNHLVNPNQYLPNWELIRDIVWEQSTETQDRLKEIHDWAGFVPEEKKEEKPGEGGNEKNEEIDKTSEQAA